MSLYVCKSFVSSLAFMIMVLICSNGAAQNLVKNPSFENYRECPSEYGCLERVVPFWHQPTYGSSDYFNSCSANMSSKENFIGLQSPFDGQAYAGMYAYGPKDYREYLTAEFKRPLRAGQTYVFSFQISLAEESQYGISEFGILFSGKPLSVPTRRVIPLKGVRGHKKYTYTAVSSREFYANKTEWTTVSGSFVAKGTERFMTLGNFNSNEETLVFKSEDNLKGVAYYYVDMVTLTPFEKAYELNELYVLENVLFDFDGFHIEEKGREQLLDLVGYLKTHSDFKVSIYGHTDNAGSMDYNKELSQKRAKAVADFLMDKGVEPGRLLWRGYGDLNPVAKNEHEEGRTQNRRVEFMLSNQKRDYYSSSSFED